jgi:glycyl-tRNA synthetase
MPAQSLDQIVSLCKRRGFIFPGSEIYGGLANTWDYGPLGVELKNRLKRLWWTTFVHRRPDMVGMDASILMNAKVWEASGHVGSFADLMCMCKFCKRLIRFDHWKELAEGSPWFHSLAKLYEKGGVTLATFKHWGETEGKKLAPNMAIVRNPSVTVSWLSERIENTSGEFMLSLGEVVRYLATEQLGSTGIQYPCPYCGGELTEPRPFNLLFKTHQGIIEDKGMLIYLRPETAQGIFVNFKNVVDTMRMRLPFGIAQIGKAFRNEITPGNFTFRTREFEQMEIEYFIESADWEKAFEMWKDLVWKWFLSLGVSKERLRIREHNKDELSHYSKRTLDIEYHFPWGWGELFGLAYRGNYDLSQHEKLSKQDLHYSDPDDQTKKMLPHVIEPSFGVDRTVLMLLLEAYTEEQVKDDMRTVMKLHPRIAPYDLAILPLSKKEPLIKKAREIYASLVEKTNWVIDFDVTGSIGKRYRRQDEIGTPKCITVDFGTIGEDPKQCAKDHVTVRDRDSLEQREVAVQDLPRVWLQSS